METNSRNQEEWEQLLNILHFLITNQDREEREINTKETRSNWWDDEKDNSQTNSFLLFK